MRILMAQSQQKSYTDKKRRPLSFKVGNRVFLKVSPRRGVLHFGQDKKLSPRFIGPFQILERVGEVAHWLALPPQLAKVHNVFHISMLRKYESYPSHVLDWVLAWNDLPLEQDASYEEEPVHVLEAKEHVLRGRTIYLVRVLWRHHGTEETTWENEKEMYD